MLRNIQIRNFAIVEQLELQMRPGMTALTGETGAGKSILVDALNLALGGRADAGVIRHQADRAEIAVDFDISNHPAIAQWLEENALDENGECLIRRIANKEGPSKGFINGRPVPMQSLRDLGEQLVDIHGQHAHQSLLKRDLQRQSLDDFAGHQQLLTEIKSCFSQLKKLKDQQTELSKSKSERDARIELLSYQIEEVQALALVENEYDDLTEEYHRLANLNQLVEGGERALYELAENEDHALVSQLTRIAGQLDSLLQYDQQLQNTVQILNEAAIQAREAANELRHYLGSLETDPGRLEFLNDRLGVLHDLSRKHHVAPNQLLLHLSNMQSELEQLQNTDEHSGQLDGEIERLEDRYTELAKKLTLSRTKSGKLLADAVSQNMQRLGMKAGKFAIDISPLDAPSSTGMDRIDFQVSANPGEPLKPLAKVASGGELSRISLAIQVITAGTGRIPTLVFDEVDVGIGGGTAEVVGILLRNLSQSRQVLCVTHQPQVATQAHNHLRVVKYTEHNETQTDVIHLTLEQRVEEIARMLGGVKITEQTLSHAQEMLERASTASIA